MLWEEERNRFTFTDGVLYNQFLSVPDFETVRSYAEQMGVLIWANAQKRTVVVTREGHDPVKKVWNIFIFENDFLNTLYFYFCYQSIILSFQFWKQQQRT